MELAIWQYALLFWSVFFMAFVIAKLFARRWYRRRWNDRGTEAILQDGFPGGPRGRIWTDKERAEFRRARQRRKMRVAQ